MSKSIKDHLSSPIELHFARFLESKKPRATRTLHTHQEWQIEMILNGSPVLSMSDASKKLSPLELVIIPPHVPHDFSYSSDGNHWITLRFSCDLKVPEKISVIRKNKASSFFKLISDLIGPLGPVPQSRDRTTIEFLLAAMLTQIYGEEKYQDSTQGFLEKIESYLFKNRQRPMTVDDLAKHVSYSASHTRSLYRKMSGHSVKDAIDRHRYEEARQHLLHSDQTISEISHHLGFSDPFNFSRFIKRMSSLSPKAIRNHQPH